MYKKSPNDCYLTEYFLSLQAVQKYRIQSKNDVEISLRMITTPDKPVQLSLQRRDQWILTSFNKNLKLWKYTDGLYREFPEARRIVLRHERTWKCCVCLDKHRLFSCFYLMNSSLNGSWCTALEANCRCSSIFKCWCYFSRHWKWTNQPLSGASV